MDSLGYEEGQQRSDDGGVATILCLQCVDRRMIVHKNSVVFNKKKIVGNEEVMISLPYWEGKSLTAFEYVTEYLLPNFYFHITTAYSILRANGVNVGKNDYIGEIPLK